MLDGRKSVLLPQSIMGTGLEQLSCEKKMYLNFCSVYIGRLFTLCLKLSQMESDNDAHYIYKNKTKRCEVICGMVFPYTDRSLMILYILQQYARHISVKQVLKYN